jgi:hypothetical protein
MQGGCLQEKMGGKRFSSLEDYRGAVASGGDIAYTPPEEVTPFALVALGHPDQPFGRRDRYDAARVHWEMW